MTARRSACPLTPPDAATAAVASLAFGLALLAARLPAQTTTVAAGARVTFSADADGTQPFSYQWRRDGQPLPGASQRDLVLVSSQPSDSGAYDVIIRNALGSATSNQLTLAVVATPQPGSGRPDVTLVSAPAPAVAGLGETASFSVAAASAAGLPLLYQWRRDGLNLPGATGTLLAVTRLADNDFGEYSVVVTSAAGSVTSPPATLRRLGAAAAAPMVSGLPLALDLPAGGSLVLRAQPSGEPWPAVQWRRDGVDLPGATTSVLALDRAAAGTYTVSAVNSAGSASASTRVSTGATEGRLVNLSTLAPAGAADASLIVGFVIGGSGRRDLLARAVGPTLAAFGVEGSLADPGLEVLDGTGRVLLTNNDWGETPTNAAAVTTASGTAGAFPLPTGSRDAAVATNLAPGAYTMRVAGASARSGRALAEAYDLGPSAAASRLANLSTRNVLVPGGDPLVAGFVTRGPAATTVLVRAVGPTLSVFGVPGALPRPQLRLFDSAQRLVATNAAWESSHAGEALVELMARVGAFALPRGSADACLALTLPPGAYTAEISGVNGATGATLLEVYEIR